MLKLVRPNIKFKRSYLQAAVEYKKVGMFKNVDIDFARNNFKTHVNRIKSRKYGKNLPPTYPNAEIEYWLIDGNIFVGRIGIRKTLTKEQREKVGHIGISIRPSKRQKGYGYKGFLLSLKKAKINGMKNVLLICKESNQASKKIIEKIGGRLMQRVVKKNKPNRLRYSVKLDG